MIVGKFNMTSYVALLRGISPSNPNMRNEKLRAVFSDLGLDNVQSVISSGNILFETQPGNTEELEENIEKALTHNLGFTSTTIIYSKKEFQSLIKKNPFKTIKETPQCKRNVTFIKNKPRNDIQFPYHPESKGFIVLGMYERAIYSVVDLSNGKTPELMRWVEKVYGNNLTTRTWKTVNRILKKFD